MTSLYKTSITSLPLLGNGKVRDNYAVGDDKLLIVTTDRLSAFDVIMNEPIPGKGKVLNQMSDFWFEKLGHIVPNHLTGIAPETVVAANEVEQVRGRAVVAKRLKPILVEAVVRGYIIGSGWKDYQDTGSICSIKLYKTAADYAATRGIIIADTKFEFGLDDNGVLHLMDEVLTADSSRFWPADSYKVGISPPSFDKQFVRDYLETVDGWKKTPPAPALPTEVIEKTGAKYREALERLTGNSLKD